MTNSAPGQRALLVAGLACLAYLLAALLVQPAGAAPFFGTDIYNRWYLAILDGHLDLPARVLRIEGHYLADGTGYPYHGAAPLLTRFLFGWLLPTDGNLIPRVSLFLWSVVGTAAFHWTAHDVARRALADKLSNLLALTIALAAWTASPGPLLVANISYYQEPIALAYAMAGLAFALTNAFFTGRAGPAKALIGMALLIAIAAHARPNVAVGLGVGGGLLGLLMLLRYGKAVLLPGMAAMTIVAASGLGYFELNKAKFGDATIAHGSFDPTAEVVLGNVFWKQENPDGPRARTFRDHGRFDAARIPVTAAIHAAAMPIGDMRESWMFKLTSSVEPRLGFLRIEGPSMGAFWLYFPWLAIFLLGLGRGMTFGPQQLVGLALALPSALLILAYATIALRYRFELFPLFFALAMIAMPNFLARAGQRAATMFAFALAVVIGFATTFITARSYSRWLNSRAILAEWSEEKCLALATRTTIPPARRAYVCRD